MVPGDPLEENPPVTRSKEERPDDHGEPPLALAVAVVGPANSGKTTLLNLLDDALQRHPGGHGACVVKGSPDGTGRYLFHVPEVRERVKERVKGEWSSGTIETIRAWIDNARRTLELVLVDVGGRHAPDNARLFRSCSHFIVVARRFGDAGRERDEGMDSWVRTCCDSGLVPVARVRSLWGTGGVCAEAGPDGALEATFRSDAGRPEDTLNDALVRALVERLVALRRPRDPHPYIDLHLGRAWTPADIPDVGGCAGRIAVAALRGDVYLGGLTPIWAYAAALHHALDIAPETRVRVFDPKRPSAVEIPASLNASAGGNPWTGLVELRWQWIGPTTEDATLDLWLTAGDRLLPAGIENELDRVPLPEADRRPERIVVSGAVPVWLHLALSRALRIRYPGVRIGAWDQRLQQAVFFARRGETA